MPDTPALPDRARVVIVGGGIVGCSLAYHLTRRGCADVLLLERHSLTSGTTWHAAGLVGQLRATHNLTRLAQYTTGLYAGLERQTLEDRARALLERFGLAHRADHRPGQVSGGQAQRVAVCRALVNAPVVVLADEPTGNLDPDNAGLVMDALADAAAEGRTVVVATHDPAVVARADEVVRL